MNILLIEPDKQLSAVYVAAFESAGYTATATPGAQNAIHIVEQTKFDLIVLELQLVDHNGIELLYELRSYAEWQSIPVVVLTMVPPDALAVTPEILRQLGVVHCLYKPATSLATLLATIERM